MTRSQWDSLPQQTKDALIATIELAAAAIEKGLPLDESQPPVRQQRPAMFPIHPNDHPRG